MYHSVGAQISFPRVDPDISGGGGGGGGVHPVTLNHHHRLFISLSIFLVLTEDCNNMRDFTSCCRMFTLILLIYVQMYAMIVATWHYHSQDQKLFLLTFKFQLTLGCLIAMTPVGEYFYSSKMIFNTFYWVILGQKVLLILLFPILICPAGKLEL